MGTMFTRQLLTLEIVGSVGVGHAVAWLVNVVDGQTLLVTSITCINRCLE